MSIQEIDSEKVIRGSNEGFADSIKINTALIRRRLRSTRLKCKEVKKGLRGHSNVDILYVRDLVKPGLVEEVEKNLDSYVIDHVGIQEFLNNLLRQNGIHRSHSFRPQSGRMWR